MIAYSQVLYPPFFFGCEILSLSSRNHILIHVPPKTCEMQETARRISIRTGSEELKTPRPKGLPGF